MAKEPHAIDASVGLRIQSRRKQLHLSQVGLGEQIGVTFQQVQKYESGANRVSASRLQQIANVLRVTPSYFFDGDADSTSLYDGFEDELEKRRASKFLKSQDGSALLKAFLDIEDTSVRASIVTLVQALAAAGHQHFDNRSPDADGPQRTTSAEPINEI